MMEDSRVLVIGAGPCGLLSGLLLARLGVPCLVVDARKSPSLHPRAMGVTERTAEIYRQLGLLEQMRKEDLPLTGLSLSICAGSLGGEEFGRTALAESASEYTPCAAFHCPQPQTEKILLEALRRERLAEVRYGEKVTRVENFDDGVRVTMGNNESVHFPWVIAADGAGSPVRRQLGIEATGPGDMGHFVNVYFEADYGARLEDRKAILYHCVSTEYSEFFVAVNGGNLWLMHHFLQPGETVEDYSEEKLREIIRRASGFKDIVPRILSVDKWVMSPKVAEKFRRGRILLAGDAAARLSPSGGLGMNTGLQSVHNLAWKLAAVIQGNAGAALLDTYEEERLTISMERMQSTNKNAVEIFELVQAALAGNFEKVREIASHSRRAVSRIGEELGFSYKRGAFLPDNSARPFGEDFEKNCVLEARPGCRAPHFWFERKGEQMSSLDFFGVKWISFTGSDPTAVEWKRASQELKIPIETYQLGAEISCDTAIVEKLYGITNRGAVLIRPDGIVALRFREASECPQALRDGVRKILSV